MGLIVHPDRQHLIYPIGCTVIVENMETKKQDFLSGHTDTVSCCVVSKCGRFIASGQATYMGFKVNIIMTLDIFNLHSHILLNPHGSLAPPPPPPPISFSSVHSFTLANQHCLPHDIFLSTLQYKLIFLMWLFHK